MPHAVVLFREESESLLLLPTAAQGIKFVFTKNASGSSMGFFPAVLHLHSSTLTTGSGSSLLTQEDQSSVVNHEYHDTKVNTVKIIYS